MAGLADREGSRRPEDFRKDQYLLKPLFERLFKKEFGKAARVAVCQEPLLGGIGEALKSERLFEVVDRYRGMVDVYVLCVDRDGKKERRRRLDAIEKEFTAGRTFLAENAWEELETWTLAGLDLPPAWNWSDVRAEVSVKERHFDKLAEARRSSRHFWTEDVVLFVHGTEQGGAEGRCGEVDLEVRGASEAPCVFVDPVDPPDQEGRRRRERTVL